MQRDPSQGDIAYFKRRIEQVVADARQREKENELMIESKLKELEELEQDRDRYRDELEEARAIIGRMDARVPKASSRSNSRAVSPAPGSPARERVVRTSDDGKAAPPASKTRSSTEELAWLQQQKLNVVEGLEKERTRLEAELAQQTQIAQEALLEAGTKREELLQLQSARASELGELEKERHRLEIELGAQAQLAMSRAHELELRRNEVSVLGRTAADLEAECLRLRKELATSRGNIDGEGVSSSTGTPILQNRLAALNATGALLVSGATTGSRTLTETCSVRSRAICFVLLEQLPVSRSVRVHATDVFSASQRRASFVYSCADADSCTGIRRSSN